MIPTVLFGVQIPHMAAKTLVMLGLGNEDVNRRVQHTVLVPLMSQVHLLVLACAAACSFIPSLLHRSWPSHPRSPLIEITSCSCWLCLREAMLTRFGRLGHWRQQPSLL